VAALNRAGGVALLDAAKLIPHQPADIVAALNRAGGVALRDAAAKLPPHQPADIPAARDRSAGQPDIGDGRARSVPEEAGIILVWPADGQPGDRMAPPIETALETVGLICAPYRHEAQPAPPLRGARSVDVARQRKMPQEMRRHALHAIDVGEQIWIAGYPGAAGGAQEGAAGDAEVGSAESRQCRSVLHPVSAGKREARYIDRTVRAGGDGATRLQ